MKAVVLLLVGLLLATAVVALPSGSRPVIEEPQEECSDLTRFREGYKYSFIYEAVTKTGIQGTGPGSTLTMICDVNIEAPEPCKNVLKTTSCRLDESPEFAAEMERHDLVFHTNKGRIVELLAHPDEPAHILNAKRGILSMIQLDMEADDYDHLTINEVSVHGNCSSDVNVKARDERNMPRTVEVTTDLNKCLLKERPEDLTLWQTFKDVLANTTIVDKLINSSKRCTYDVKGSSGEFKEIDCDEIHSFWPLNFNSESGARTAISQSLINTDIIRLNSFKVDPDNTRRTNLKYEYNPEEVGRKPDDVTANQAIEILKQLVKGSLEEVHVDSPRLFGRWRAALEGMNNETIHEVYDRAYDCSQYSQTCRDHPDKAKLAREYLLDGLLPCTTLACFSVKNYAIASGHVPKVLAKAWMVTMAFRDYPARELIAEMLRMAQASPSQITIFPLSILIHRCWEKHEEIQTAAELPSPITDTISYFKSIIGDDCNVSPENERLALLALKGIGNIGELVERHDELATDASDEVIPSLLRCAKNKRIPRDISKAAVQSMRRFALNDQLRRRVIEEIFMDTHLDVPQRIAAYLIAMKANPTVSELTNIWNFLKIEPVKQIRAFCYSHIRNVLESSEPTMQELQRNLRKAMVDEEVPEIPQNLLKHSRYFEISRNFTEPWRNNTIAAQFESDIIYSTESYLPQEVMFHYVINALGKSWDMFETGIEIKGFEPILEAIFGPDGFFPEMSLHHIFERVDGSILTKVRDFAEQQLDSWTHSVPEDRITSAIKKIKDKFPKKVKREPGFIPSESNDLVHEMTTDKLDDLHRIVGLESSAADATVFIRLLGNELGFVSASDILSIIPYTAGIVDEFINKTKQIPQLLAKGLDMNSTRSVVFMDKSFILPTGAGMPLNCSINGTAVISLRVKSQFSFKMPKIIASGHIAPSGAIEVLGTMGIGVPTKVFTGILASSTVYHSSKIAGNITVDGTRIKINLNNTDRPMNLFNYSTTYNLMKANGKIEFIPGVLQDAVRNQRCTNVSRILGVDLCVSWAYPNASYVPEAPRFPFAGPNSFNITLRNTDRGLKAYTFDAEFKRITEGNVAHRIPFAAIGRRNRQHLSDFTKFIDTIRVSFYAPGEEHARNVTSLLSIDRLRRTAKWIFTIPELKDFIMFAGILNETTESASAYRAVFNVSAADNAASVDFLVKNETTLAQKNLTTVFNASIKNLYWSAVGQFIRQASNGDWNAHMTNTYYWDNETPLYKQILFRWTGYQINWEKYRTAKFSASRRISGEKIKREFRAAAFRWAYVMNSNETDSDNLKELTLNTKITNGTWEFPLMDMSMRRDTEEDGYHLRAEVSRRTHHAFVSYNVTKEDRETNRLFRAGVQTDLLVHNPESDKYPDIFNDIFGIRKRINRPLIIDGGFNFRILHQSDRPIDHLIETTVLIPNPREPKNHLTYDFNIHVQNASELQHKDFTLELNLPFPLLKLTPSSLLHLTADTELGTLSVEHLMALYDNRYNKTRASLSNTFNAGWKKPAANWVLTMQSPSLVYSQNYTGVYDRENGLRFFYEYNQDSADSDLLDFTEISKIFLKATAISKYYSYIHKLISYNVSQGLSLGGPITEIDVRLMPMIVRDVLNKTFSRQFSEAKDIIVSKILSNVTGSSITLRQSANVSSPVLTNVTALHYLFLSRDFVDHKITFVAEQRRLNITASLRHSMEIEDRELTLKTEGDLRLLRGSHLDTFTSLNVTLLKSTSPFNLDAVHRSQATTPILTFTSLSSAHGNVDSVNNILNLVSNLNTSLSSRFGSLEVIGNYNINDMSSPTYFQEITGILNHKLSSRLVKSSFNSSVSFNTFRKLFKFQKVQAKASHEIKSNLITWRTQGHSLFQHFSSITEFGEISTGADTHLQSRFVSASHSSAFALRNMSGLVQFDECKGHLNNELTSNIVNTSYANDFAFNNVESIVSFRKIGGSSNYALSSRLLNATANNTLDLIGFRRLFDFDRVTGKQIWFVKSRIVNATVDNHISLNGFRRLFNFDEIAGHTSTNFTSRLAEGSSRNDLSILGVDSITSVDEIAAASTSFFRSRLLNISSNNNLDVNNRRSFFDFDNIRVTSQFLADFFRVSVSTRNEATFRGFRSLVDFDSVSLSSGRAANSYYLNASSTELISLQNFRKINQFDVASTEVVSTISTPFLKASYQQTHKIEDMNGWFVYPLMENTIMGNITTKTVNVSGSYEGRISNMNAPFEYDNSVMRLKYLLSTRILDVRGLHGIEADNVRGLFNFDRINGTLSHEADTPVSHTSLKTLFELNNFQRLFTFDSINLTTSNIISITPLTTTFASLDAGLLLQGFERLTHFAKIKGFSRTAVLTKWTNWTVNAMSDFTEFRRLLEFDHIAIAGQHEFHSPFFVMISNTTNDINGSTGFFKARSAQTRNKFSLSSRVAAISSDTLWLVNNLSGPFTFTTNNLIGNLNVDTRLVNTNSEFAIRMSEWQNITHYDRLELQAGNNFTSRLIEWKLLSRFRLDNMAGILKYSRAEGSTSVILSSILSSLNTSINGHISQQSGFLTYEELVVSIRTAVDARLLKFLGNANFNVNNMAGFMTYDRVYGSIASEATSRFFNTTSQTSLRANGGTGLFKVQLANITSKISLNTPLSREIKASTSAQITNSRKLFNFDEAAIRTEATFKSSRIDITANVQSTFMNFVNLTRFNSVQSSADMVVGSRFINSTIHGIVEMQDFSRLFKFQKTRVGGYAVIESLLANMTSEAGIDFNNFRQLFTFDRINSSLVLFIASRYASLDVKSGTELNNMNGFLTFDRFNGSFITNLNSRLVNSTSAASYGLNGFRSIFNFDNIEANAETTLKSRFINGTAGADYSLRNSTRFFNFNSLLFRSAGSFTSRFAAGKAFAAMQMNHVSSPSSFDLFNITTGSRFTSKPVTALYEGVYMIRNQHGLFKFDEVRSHLNGYVKSKLVNGTVMFLSQMNNSRSLFNFDAAKTQASITVLAPISDAHVNGEIRLINFRNITHFTETSTTFAANITGKFATGRAYSSFNISNMAGFLSMDRLFTSTVTNVETRYINTTFQNSVNLLGLRPFQADAISHRFIFRWDDPVNNLVAKNGLDMKSRKDISQLFNITLVNPKGAVVFSQRLNYENLITTFKIPSIGLISAGANLNPFGDILTLYIEHQLLKDNFKPVKDITWLLRLNESNVIYSNFSWNPEPVNEIINITVAVVRNTFNRTVSISNKTVSRVLEAVNHTLTHTKRMGNCTKSFLRYTLLLVNETLRERLSELNDTLREKAKALKQIIDDKLLAYNETLREHLEVLREAIEFARANPRDFIGKHINLTKLNNTIRKLNSSLQDLIAKVKYNISHPTETLENIKIRAGEVREQVRQLLDQRHTAKENIRKFFQELRANVTSRVKGAVAEFKERINYDVNLEKLRNYIQTRFDIPKIEEKIQEIKEKVDELRERLGEFKSRVGERVNDLKGKISAIDREIVREELINRARNALERIFNRTTVDAIRTAFSIDYNDDAQVQELLRKVIRVRLYHLIHIIDRDNLEDVRGRLDEAKQRLIDGLQTLNRTVFRYANKTFINETSKRVAEKLEQWNTTLHDLVHVDLIRDDIRFLLESTKEVVTNFIKAKADIIREIIKEKWDARPKSLEELRERLNEFKAIFKDYVQERFNVNIDEVAEKIITQLRKRREQAKLAISALVEISKDDSHLVNMLPLCYFDRTIFEIAQPPVNATVQLTISYGRKIANFTRVYGKKVVNFTIVNGRLAVEKGREKIRELIPKINETLREYKALTIEKGEVFKGKAMVFISTARENATRIYQKYAPVINESLRNYTTRARIIIFEYSVKMRNITDQIVNRVVEYIEPRVEPYRDLVAEKVELVKNRVADLKQRIRELPDKTEKFLMDAAEYHIDRYPDYKQRIAQRIRQVEAKIEELKTNLTRLYTEVRANITRLVSELRQNITDTYTRYSARAQEIYTLSQTKFSDFRAYAKEQYKRFKPLISQRSIKIIDASRLRANLSLISFINATKDEFSLINEVPMRVLDKTIYELSQELKEKLQQVVEDVKESVKESIRNRESLINRYPVRYFNLTLFETGNFTYKRLVMVSNRTRFYATRAVQYVDTSLSKANETIREALISANQTIREVVIPFLRESTGDFIAFLNSTRYQAWNVTLDQTLSFLNKTSSLIRAEVRSRGLSFRNRAVEAWTDFTSEENIERMKDLLNKTKDIIIVVARRANDRILLLRNKTIDIIVYIREETQLVTATKDLAVRAKDFTQISISKVKSVSQETIDLARNATTSLVDYLQGPVKNKTFEYLVYVNNTMAGWAFRYYEVHQIPGLIRTKLAAIKPLGLARNWTKYTLNRTALATKFALIKSRVASRQVLNQTGILIRQAVKRTRTMIRDTLNRIGRLDDHSFAMNITHPFNWTSFRTLPRLSNSQVKFIKDKVRSFNQTVVIPFITKLQAFRNNMTERYNNVSTRLRDLYETKKPIIEERLEELRVKLNERIEEMKLKLQERIDYYKQWVNESRDSLREKWETEWKLILLENKAEILNLWFDVIKPKIEETVTELKTLYNDPELVTKLKEKASRFRYEYLPEVKRELVEEKIPEWKRQLQSRYEKAKETIEVFKQNITIFREKLEARIEEIRQNAQEKLQQLRDNLADFKENWPDTYEKFMSDIEDFKKQLKTKVTNSIYILLSIIRQMRLPLHLPPTGEVSIYRPWKYTAMLFGENHVMTFDGKVYSLPEYDNDHQTYVLAHDFIDRNFTLLDQRRRITLLVSNLSVTIDNQNVVYIDGMPIMQELPYQSPYGKELTIMRKGPWVNVTTTKGIALSCNSDMIVCIFHVSGWYHGRSRGLLGNLDTEYHNEFILPLGEITNDVAEFINAYDVSPFDFNVNIVDKIPRCPADLEKCESLFLEENSDLNQIFDMMNMTEFYNFCIEQTKLCLPTCEATNPAVTLGKELRVDVSYEPNCLDCAIGNEVEEIGIRRTNADVVFIISETAAIAEDNILQPSLKTIARNIKSQLNHFNVTDVKYGIVAFGGEDIHSKPHSHTLCGMLLDDGIPCVDSGIDSLAFQGERPLDAMYAVKYAASYPFRKQAAKIIILIADEDLPEEIRKPWDFILRYNSSLPAMQKLLDDQGITFNVFSSYPSLNKKTTESPVLGVNYLGQQITKKKNSGEVGISRLSIPDGQYAKLAKSTRGSILGLRWLQNGHRDMNTMLPKVIWKQIHPQITGQVDYTCRCVQGWYGEAREECQISRFPDDLF